MESNQIKNIIKTALINDLEQALRYLEKVIKSSSSKKNDLIMQQARYNETKRNLMNGMLPANNAQMTYSHIRNALLYLIDNIEEEDIVKDVELPKEAATSSAKNEGSQNIGNIERKGPLKFFISYAREDENAKERLKKALFILERRNFINIWDASQLIVGDARDKEIKNQLMTADVICLLVSNNFVSSEYIWSKEMEAAVERHRNRQAAVAPILIQHVPDYDLLPFAEVSALPSDQRPITNWDSPDEAWNNIAKGLRALVEKRRKELQIS